MNDDFSASTGDSHGSDVPTVAAPLATVSRLAAGLALVLLVAVALRARGLQVVPVVTDESEEVRYAWDIAFEGARPLTHTDAYNGPLWPYLMAVTLRLAGPSVDLPRAFTFVFGIGAVLLTFALGALLAEDDRRASAATIAGLVVAASFTSTLVSSRVAWSNSTTPFWTTLAALLLVLAVRRPSSITRWVAAGLASGLALNTHPSVVAYLAGLAAWLLLDRPRRDLLRSAGPWLALAVCVAAYLPVIVYNVTGPADTLAQAAESRNLETEPGPASYAANLAGLLGQLGRSLVGGFDAAETPIWGARAAVVALLALGLTVAAARSRSPHVPGRRLPLLVCLATVLLLPAVNQNWTGFLEARYLALLAPPVGVAAGVAVTAGRSWRVRRAAAVGSALLILVPAVRSWRHVDTALGSGNTNGAMLELVRVAGERSRVTRAPAPILVADELEDVAWPHRGDPARAVTYYLMLAGVPFETERLDTIRHLVAEGTPAAVVMPGPAAEAMGLESLASVLEEGYQAWGLYSAARDAGNDRSRGCAGAIPEQDARASAIAAFGWRLQFEHRMLRSAVLMPRAELNKATPPPATFTSTTQPSAARGPCVWVVELSGVGQLPSPLGPDSFPSPEVPHFSRLTVVMDADSGVTETIYGWDPP